MKQSVSLQPLKDELDVQNAENESTTSETTALESVATDQLYLSLGKQTHKLIQSELSNDHLHRALADLRRKLSKAVAEKIRLQTDVQEHKDTIEAFEVEVGELAGENAKLKEDMGELALENSRLKEEIGEQEAVITELKENGDALAEERAWRMEKDQENKELRKELKEKAEAIAALRREDEVLKNLLNEKTTSLGNLDQTSALSPKERMALRTTLINQVKAVIDLLPPGSAVQVAMFLHTLSEVIDVMIQDQRNIERLENEKARYQARRSEALSLLETGIEAVPTRGTKEAAVQTSSDGGEVSPMQLLTFGKGEGTKIKSFDSRFSTPARSDLLGGRGHSSCRGPKR
ncbi:serine threonine sps1 [Moniliophthora roreri]|nr:serine threonine sps1 [Moniliophthora roreri]